MGDAEAEHLLLAGKTLDKVRRVLYSAVEPDLPRSPPVKQPSPLEAARKELTASISGSTSASILPPVSINDWRPLIPPASAPIPSGSAQARRSPALGQMQHISASMADPSTSTEDRRSTPMFTNLLEAAAFISPDQRAAMLAQMTQGLQKRKAPDPPRPQSVPTTTAAPLTIPPISQPPEASKRRKLASAAANDYSALDVLADQATSQFPNAQVGMHYEDPRAVSGNGMIDEEDEDGDTSMNSTGSASGQRKGAYAKWTPAEVSLLSD